MLNYSMGCSGEGKNIEVLQIRSSSEHCDTVGKIVVSKIHQQKHSLYLKGNSDTTLVWVDQILPGKIISKFILNLMEQDNLLG